MTDEFPGTERFEVTRKLGVGGMGVVYAVRDRDTGESLALKTLTAPKPGAIARLKREFRVLSGLAHDNLVHLHGLHEVDGRVFITMELVDGVEAEAWVREADVPTDAVAALARDLIEGLRFLHSRGRLHMDVKPSNVLVHRSGRALLSDFGLSRVLNSFALDRPVVRKWGGTLAYMPPEQLNPRSHLSVAADWYALGATLYELYSGHLPFPGTYRRILEAKQTGKSADPIRTWAPDLDPTIADLIDRLLSVRPEDRPGGREVARVFGVDERASGFPQVAAPGELVGRWDELEALHAHGEAALHSGVEVVEVRGISGIGKTSLLRGFLSARRDVATLVGTCFEREWVPFNAFDTMISNFVDRLRLFPERELQRLLPRDVDALVRLFPVFERVPLFAEAAQYAGDVVRPGGARQQAFTALAEVLEEWAEGRLLVLAIDDVQWADRDSRALLEHLIHGSPLRPLLVVLLHRVPEEGEATELDLPVNEILELGPLDIEAARELASRAGGEDDSWVQAILDESGGVPLWIEQLGLRGFARDGQVPRLDTLFERTIQSLEEEDRQVLDALAVAGRPTGVAVLAEALPLDTPVRALDRLRQEGLAVVLSSPDGPTHGVRHARVRELALELLSGDEHARVSGRLAEALINREGDAEEIARHLYSAGDPLQGAEYAIVAARQATAALAFDRAASLLQSAIDVLEDERRVGLWEELGDVLANDARAEAAAQAYLSAAAATDDPNLRVRLRHQGAEQLMRSGRIDQGKALLEELLDAEGLSLPSTPAKALLGMLWRRFRLRLRGTEFEPVPAESLDRTRLTRIDAAWSASVTLALVDAVTAASFQTRGLLEALDLGEPERIGRSLGAEAVFRAAFGDHDAARDLWEQNRRVVELAPSPSGLAGLATSRAVAAYQRGDWALCHRSAGEALRHLEGQRVNLSWIRSTAVIYRLAAAGHLGLLDELRQALPEELAFARARGDLHAELHLSLGMPVPLAAVEDRAELGRVEAQAVWDASPGHDYDQVRIHFLRTQGELALYQGDGEQARAAGLESWELVRSGPSRRIPIVHLSACELAARGILATCDGPPDRSDRRVLERIARLLSGAGVPWAAACGTLVTAQIALLDDRPEQARLGFQDAAAAFASAGMGLYAAASRHRVATLLDPSIGGLGASDAVEWIRDRRGVCPERLMQMVAPALAGRSRDAWGPGPERPAVTDRQQSA